jgi:sugar (pentulose or hexulose) kinase
VTRDYLVGLDIGTSALKGVLAHRRHGVVAVAETEYPMHRPHPGWAENDAGDWLRAAAIAVPRLLDRGGIGADRVAAVCIVSQRDIAVLVDEHHEPVAPCIHWSDRRDPHETAALFDRLDRDRLLDTTGTAPIPGLVLPNLAWTAAHRPDLVERARVALSPKDFVAARLTGEPATDRTTPTRSLLNDWRSERWDEAICVEAGIPPRLLPEVRYASWEVRAELDERAGTIGLAPGTLLAAGGGDDPAAALGCGVTEPGEVSVGASSSTSIRVVSTRPSVHRGIPLGVLPHVVPGRYLHEMVAVGTGTSLRWLRAALTPPGATPLAYPDLLALAAGVERGAAGVLFFPYVEGASVPIDNDRVRAAVLGIEPHHDQRHLVRAAIESIAYAYPSFIDLIEEAGHAVGRITIADGEARSALWNQVKADVMGRPLHVATVAEAPAVGAAILAGLAAGIFASPQDGVTALTAPHAVYVPDRAAHAEYTRHRRRWETVQSHLLAATELVHPADEAGATHAEV